MNLHKTRGPKCWVVQQLDTLHEQQCSLSWSLDDEIECSFFESPPIFTHPLPPLPEIEGDDDILLDVWAHRSLRRNGGEDGDNLRLSDLGEQIFPAVITQHCFSRRPRLSRREIVSLREDVVSDPRILAMSRSYNIARRLKVPAGYRMVEDDVEELRHFWYRFIGALSHRNGLDAVQVWVSNLIDFQLEAPTTLSGPPSPSTSTSTLVNISNHVHIYSPAPTPRPPAIPLPQPDPVPAPYMNPPNFVPLPRGQNGTHSPFSLAFFHQRILDEFGIQPTYVPEHEGSPHAGKWTIRCFMGTAEMGRGVGPNQKQAKNSAARQVWFSLWGNQ
ncbi:hypothetical protein BDN72DRAFT_95888 [Pluteus cervinus]|uniref:Uncharacterized protein n=1 Tax=Pluteus cervinus TaxID=181527 RepID=A0ACD3ANV6_9AGAR|nr:hypothetical protein BDN72DRAFT_95888 [Pluteus cervinus]